MSPAVRIGAVYRARVAGRSTCVLVEGAHPSGGWAGVNLRSGRQVRVSRLIPTDPADQAGALIGARRDLAGMTTIELCRAADLLRDAIARGELASGWGPLNDTVLLRVERELDRRSILQPTRAGGEP